MKIYLFLKEKLISFSLPQEISGSFSFDENNEEESKLINIEARDNNWFLYSTDDVMLMDNNIKVNDKLVSPNSFYVLRKNNINYLIYIYDSMETKLTTYKYDDKLNLIIGNTNDCNIRYKCPFFNGCIARIYYYNNNYVLNTNGGYIYINNKIVTTNQIVLKYGDQISIYSLKIIFLNNFIIINNPNNDNNFINVSSGLALNNFNFSEYQELEIKDQELYSKDDYFSKSPRIRRRIETKTIKLSTPPRTNTDEDMPILLTIGPMLTMAIVSFVMVGSSLSSILSNKSSLTQQLPSLISGVAMVISMLLWPLLIQRYNKKRKEKKKKEIVEKYNKYLSDKNIELELETKEQRDILYENLITSEECINIIRRKGYNFWDKRLDQDDFLELRIGIGDVLLDAKIEYPDEGFTIEEDELKKQADKLVEKNKYIKDVPIGYSFSENRITAIMGNEKKFYDFINNIILQIVTFYSYDDVKFVVFTNEKNASHWDYIKYLNHNFNNERSFRFFSKDIDNNKYISEYLLNEVNNRLNNNQEFPKPHYIIITDDYDKIKKYDFLKLITETEEKIGFSIIILESRLSKLPSKCNNFISLGLDNQGGLLKNSFEKQEQLYFTDEVNSRIDMIQISKVLSNIPIEFEVGISHLPDAISFLEMEKVGKVEQLNILNRWNINDSTSSLKAEIGIDEQGDLMYLDLHEKAHGPHGLIAGTTGSGKSEFIITYILSMCINYSPDDISFILIDYKGGGLALAFENKSAGVILPHLAGTITNLDKAEMDRTLVSIDSEVKRRQKMFNEARERLGESTIDIYKYQTFYHDGRLDEPIPHLFIICDEFAELKSQQPEFMDNLISVARIGRSLGVHLILATQKPSGVVNDQIWSNSRFKVCLKVQDENDSREMLKKNDAAYIKQVGRYYLQVGYDEYYALGQSGWCGAKYYPSDKIIKQVDKSINIINDCGLFLKSIQASSNNKVEAKGDQLSVILDDIIMTSKRLNKSAKKLWLDNIPEVILIDKLHDKYNIIEDLNNIEAIIGEYDAPERQEQGLVRYNYIKNGNTLIYGNDGTERELLINAIIYSTTKYYSSKYVNFYAVDFGSESLQKYISLPHFGGVVVNGEDEEFNNLMKLIKNEIIKRKKLFADYGSEYVNYIKNSGEIIPLMVIILNNYDSIYENYQNLYDDLPELVRDSERYGIIYIITGNTVNSIHSRISSSCPNIYAFKLKESSDYSSLFGINTKVIPRQIKGRGVLKNNGIHEFQTAYITEDNDNLNKVLDSFINDKKNSENVYAKKIPLLPDIVRYNDVKDEFIKLNSIPIGISKNDLDIINVDLKNNIGYVISSNKISNMEIFIKSLLLEIRSINNINLFIFDSMKLLNLDTKYFQNYIVNDIGKAVGQLIKYIESLINNKQSVEGVIVIYSLNKFVNSTTNKQLDDLSKVLKNYEKITLLIVDDTYKIKQYMYESWFSSLVNKNEGIWIGKGISNQNAFQLGMVTREMNAEIKNDMGYFISEGSATLCKFIDFVSKDDENGK